MQLLSTYVASDVGVIVHSERKGLCDSQLWKYYAMFVHHAKALERELAYGCHKASFSCQFLNHIRSSSFSSWELASRDVLMFPVSPAVNQQDTADYPLRAPSLEQQIAVKVQYFLTQVVGL